LKEYSTKKYVKMEAVIGGKRKNVITISKDNKKIIKKQSSNNSRGCSGCSRRRQSN